MRILLIISVALFISSCANSNADEVEDLRYELDRLKRENEELSDKIEDQEDNSIDGNYNQDYYQVQNESTENDEVKMIQQQIKEYNKDPKSHPDVNIGDLFARYADAISRANEDKNEYARVTVKKN
jgi:hypothetical protein